MTKAKRKYRKRKRADAEQETRRRITEALVELHGSIGPARTTIREIAERAGVQRATVYRHFPDEASLFAACSSHWAEQNPFPDPARWATIGDRGERLASALAEMYEFYDRNERMLDNTTRDEPRIAALSPSMEAFRGYLRSAAAVLASDGEGPPERLVAAVGHALAFSTWRSLVREQGLSAGDAVSLMVGMLRQAETAGSVTADEV